MDDMAKWIWYPFDYEVYHSLKLHARREEYGYRRPCCWRQDDCWHDVVFRKTAVLAGERKVRFCANGEGHLVIDGQRLPYGEYVLGPGKHELEALVCKLDGLPCAYADGGEASTDESWEATCLDGRWHPAGCSDFYREPEDNPEVFPFAYEPILPVSAEEINGGVLYDFGKETFARIAAKCGGVPAALSYGESREEALDPANSIVRDRMEAGEERLLPPRALRWLFVTGPRENFSFSAEYEYLPLEYRGAFRCSDEKLNRIWDTCAYTFHLNSREFFLDGIKRDRWVWSGDAYQSYLVNNYLFRDGGLTRRTIAALRGKEPFTRHINTILDYSLYWVLSIGEYYADTGDAGFVRSLWEKMVSLMEFCLSRTDKDGFATEHPGDWIFIDWAPLDKEYAACAEQMLLAAALETMADCGQLAGADGQGYRQKAAALREKIAEKFWDEEKGAYIDSFASGKRLVTRHTNLFALRYGFAEGKKREKILRNVLQNDAVEPITTPYFKFYELEAWCEMGELDFVRREILSYWGGMLDMGATSVWETFDPRESGAEHYAMYGDKFGKSLCHAWGASPVYLLGKYFLGVKPASGAWETFTVEPGLGGLEWMEGTVPTPRGDVKVRCRGKIAEAAAPFPSGTLVWGGKSVPIPAGETVFLEAE